MTIVDYGDSIEATSFDFNPNAISARIKSVLDEFLDYLSRTFNHLSCCNLANRQLVELLD